MFDAKAVEFEYRAILRVSNLIVSDLLLKKLHTLLIAL